jgi:hypothetical protein
MGKAIKFSVDTQGPSDHYVTEDGGRQAAWYLNKGPAKAHAEHCNKEHANGRVVQAKCSKGEPCDRDRVHVDPRELSDVNRAALVLCEDHRGLFAK